MARVHSLNLYAEPEIYFHRRKKVIWGSIFLCTQPKMNSVDANLNFINGENLNLFIFQLCGEKRAGLGASRKIVCCESEKHEKHGYHATLKLLPPSPGKFDKIQYSKSRNTFMARDALKSFIG